jgi:type II secretory ATPase GspE/PulE/Tfp pilus assembly ATPase PilB-like protein
VVAGNARAGERPGNAEKFRPGERPNSGERPNPGEPSNAGEHCSPLYRGDSVAERALAHDDRKSIELRLAIMPTTHGLRAAVRMPADLIQPRTLDELGLPAHALTGLKHFAAGDSGMLIITGPAGSGKTTTIYALLEHIACVSPGLSLVALEDPVERDIPGVTQIEVSPFGQLTYERALRSILRQDPQVLMLGEIRDAATASLAIQAALSGHRLICTLHASTPGGAVARLLEMGLEPYRITSALHGVIAQRLLRRLSVDRADASEIQQTAARQDDYSSLRDSADSLVAQHLTDLAEVERVFGCSP